jgi:REP element-mobilizing transposase RayT
MARPLRVILAGAWYHVVARGVERRRIFSDVKCFRRFEELLGELSERFGARVLSYVLMSNHYHLQLASPQGNLSRALQWLNVSYAVWFNQRSRRVGPLFQGRFKAVVHDPQESGWLIHEYIHLNPVRLKRFGAGKTDPTWPSEEQFREMSKELETYRWSSFRAYAGLAPVPSWLEVKAVYELMPLPGGGAKRRATMYRKHFAKLLLSDDLGSGWKEQLIAGLVIGGEAFVEKVRRLVAGDRNEHTALRALEKPPVEWEKITAAVENVWGEAWEVVSERHGDPAREVAMLIAREQGGMTLREIGQKLGGMSYAAVSDAVRRTRQRLTQSGQRVLVKRLREVRRILNL